LIKIKGVDGLFPKFTGIYDTTERNRPITSYSL